MMPPLHAALAHPMGGGRVDRRRREQPTRPEEERERIPQSGRRVPIVPLLPAPFSSGPFPPRRKYPFTAETSSRRQRGIRVEALFFIILLHFWRPTFHSTNGTSPEVLRHKQLSSVVLSSEGKEAWRKRPYVRLALRTSLALFESTLARSLSPLAALFPSLVHPATLSLSLSLFFFVVDYQMAKRPEKKRSILWGAKARAYTLLFSSRSFFGLRHDDSYHNYTLSRQQSSVLRENKQTKKKGCVCMCVWVRARACRFVSRKHSATFASLSPFWLFLFFVFCFPARHRRRVAPSGTVTAEKNLATSKVFIFFSLHVDCWLEKCTALPDPPFRTQLPVFFFFVRVYLISWCSLQHHYHLRFSLDL